MDKKVINQSWLDMYVGELQRSGAGTHQQFERWSLCPCCHFPTLSRRGQFDICALCNWEDDGQDDHNADKILYGPNQDYSLTEARANFVQYLTSYRPSDTYHFNRTTFKSAFNGENAVDLTEMKRKIIEMYHQALHCPDAAERNVLMQQAMAMCEQL